ncbi:uncharacterized protein B0H18DRAFT_937670 [Fomitopsis serialis]|uniref:uncharacterized protein n=1 Tax=Fomitopsis serialis TaxID=139415 RepID=UPI0020079C38|nr:uncharacterized protein B0H18DRAFT_937670 [Neoantrodia serialis]KAH9918641.1 hypothetical protein B0H18DRAFT_937670 [Neoantrodia serialis]
MQRCSAEQARDLSAAWRQEYRGPALENFLQAMQWYEANYDSSIHHGRTIAILQSSGCGKSRLVDELASKVRSSGAQCLLSCGWPPGDTMALKFFEDHSAIPIDPPPIRSGRAISRDLSLGEEIAAAFLGALIGEMADDFNISRLKGKRSGLGIGPPGSRRAANRERFFQAVYDRANAMLRVNETFLTQERDWVSMFIPPSRWHKMGFNYKVSSDVPKDRSVEWHQALFERFCRPASNHLSNQLASLGERKFFLALDECTALGSAGNSRGAPSPLPRSSLVAFQRILKAAEILEWPVCFWFLLLDTNPSVIMPHPSSDVSFSRRASDLKPLPPFVYLGFNQLIDRMTREKAADSLVLGNLKYSGRPLWATMPAYVALACAKQKLFASQQFVASTPLQVLAAFASRACLELSGNEAANRMAARAVSHHMRILVSVVKDTLITAVPAEPILAIAFADALNRSEDTYGDALETLMHQLEHQTLALGDTGELCSRLLLLLARDRATLRVHKRFVSDDMSRMQIFALELHELLGELLGENFGFEEQKELAKRLLAFCKGKWVNFYQFVKFEKDVTELDAEDLEHAWFIGAAIQCRRNQAVIDGGIVAYAGSLYEPFERRNLIFIPYQIKGKTARTESKVGLGLTAPPIIHPKHDGSGIERVKPQTIVLLMDLKSSSAFEETGRMTRRELRAAERATRWAGYADPAMGEEEPQNFFLNIRGCSSTVYPVLEPFAHTFQSILSHDPDSQLPAPLKAMEIATVEAMFPLTRM